MTSQNNMLNKWLTVILRRKKCMNELEGREGRLRKWSEVKWRNERICPPGDDVWEFRSDALGGSGSIKNRVLESVNAKQTWLGLNLNHHREPRISLIHKIVALRQQWNDKLNSYQPPACATECTWFSARKERVAATCSAILCKNNNFSLFLRSHLKLFIKFPSLISIRHENSLVISFSLGFSLSKT